MEWVVGQWVEWSGLAWKVVEPHRDGVSLESKDGTGALQWVGEYATEQPKPFVWQVGKTYKTTLEGVTATITKINDGILHGTTDSPVRLPWSWNGKTGLLCRLESKTELCHLLPFLADGPSEPEPTLTERYTLAHDGGPWWLLRDNQRGQVLPFATRELAEHALELAKSGEGLLGWKVEEVQELDEPAIAEQPDPINPRHYRDHPSGVECIQVAEHMSYCLGNAIKYLWRAGKKGDAVEDLKKAVWYVNREIERLTKGGAE